MKKWVKTTLIATGSLIGAIAISIGSFAIVTPYGFRTVLANITAPTLDFIDYGFDGRELMGIQYSEISESTTLDLYIPNDVKDPKLMVLVHGGGFSYNDSTSRQAQFMYRYFRTKGYAVASLNYRLSGEAKYPAAINDVKSALRWLDAKSDIYGYDASGITIWGESAGAYLATMAAFSSKDEYVDTKYVGEAEEVSNEYKISGLIDHYGLYKIEDIMPQFKEEGWPGFVTKSDGDWANGIDNGIAESFFGIKVRDMDDDYLKEINPVTRIGQTNIDMKVYIAHGDTDITVPYMQSEYLNEKAKERFGHLNVKFDLYKNYKHADDRFYTSDKLSKIEAFLSNSHAI
ncbi:MAG: alpha/beta hydrolase [Bacilli bacterium]|nr:alpha/beta hydrolase [Bacilli bacterium]